MCSVKLPEKTTWSIDEIYNQIYPDSKYKDKESGTGPETYNNLKLTLKSLEEKGAIIFVDGFKSINLIEPKLQELVNLKTKEN